MTKVKNKAAHMKHLIAEIVLMLSASGTQDIELSNWMCLKPCSVWQKFNPPSLRHYICLIKQHVSILGSRYGQIT